MADRGEPTLSILIPVYNWPVGPLVRELQAQVERGGLAHRVDIHLFDDGSDAACAQALRALATPTGRAPEVQVHSLGRNVGRAEARNQLLERSRGDWLLFLDADVLPDRETFVSDYLAAAVNTGSEAICGGLSYSRCADVGADQRFYFRYSSRASVAAPQLRNSRAWAWVFTSNMLVSRRLVRACPFDASFSGYGYEDLEWGIRLDRHGGVLHLDNPVTHLGLLSKPVLQRKTREAAPNLVRMHALHPDFVAAMSLLRTARWLAWLPAGLLQRLARVVGWVFTRCNCGFAVELLLFQFEKLLWTGLALRVAR